MFTLTISLDSLALYIVAADILILLSYVLYLFHRKRQLNKAMDAITDFITGYFNNSGAETRVTCFKLDANNHFVTLIESEPLKRFRYSIILENNLISHIFKTTGIVIEKIYWRFPIKPSPEIIATPDGNNLADDDSYFSDAYALAKAQGEYQVSEVPWDQYENSTVEK
ncbi:hypothetical protein TPL01_07110 [Sulfuriferula plumbiphila]|uniref:Uncharacterized protein n=1 Tax=Sulfuriferula plumbiphila TaxID=171865 RepID=A0A512L523_9PROT|nr:hypothetical protein [Sulfuriferula plumbiphila]BBP05804.1 hypothetical protein SFPGR_32260 [Sulfuriferula plumbiphila]GEP29573.1 hypothetical protein TPL01_07110 [Sulfuriferula plumbiphila]